MVQCNRCSKDVVDHEWCWYCGEALCSTCSEDFGYCGHPEVANVETGVVVDSKETP